MLEIMRAWSKRMNPKHHTWCILSSPAQKKEIVKALEASPPAFLVAVEERFHVQNGKVVSDLLILDCGDSVPVCSL